MVASAAAHAAGPAMAALNESASSASTRVGSVATTVAVRGTSRSRAISPMPSPRTARPQVATGCRDVHGTGLDHEVPVARVTFAHAGPRPRPPRAGPWRLASRSMVDRLSGANNGTRRRSSSLPSGTERLDSRRLIQGQVATARIGSSAPVSASVPRIPKRSSRSEATIPPRATARPAHALEEPERSQTLARWEAALEDREPGDIERRIAQAGDDHRADGHERHGPGTRSPRSAGPREPATRRTRVRAGRARRDSPLRPLRPGRRDRWRR